MQAVTPAIQTVLDFIQAINEADIGRLRGVMTDGHVFVDALGNRFAGVEAMIAGWQHFLHAYPSYAIAVNDVLDRVNDVAVFGNAFGKWRVGDAVSAQAWSVRAAWFAKVAEHKIASWSVYCDYKLVKTAGSKGVG